MGPNLFCYLLLDGYNTWNFTVRLKNNTLFQKLFLTVGLDLSISTAVEELSVVGSASAAGSITIQSLEWKSVWISTAASFGVAGSFDTRFDWASLVGGWIKNFVSEFSVVNLVSAQEQRHQVLYELSFNWTSSNGAHVSVVQFSARSSQIDTGTGSSVVSNWLVCQKMTILENQR